MRLLPFLLVGLCLSFSLPTVPPLSVNLTQPELEDPENESLQSFNYPGSKKDFEVFVDALDQLGVNVLITHYSKAGQNAPDRPRVAPLAGYLSDQLLNKEIKAEEIAAWMKSFADGSHGALLGIRTEDAPSKYPDFEEFKKQWDTKKNAHEKIFISYTAKDRVHAEAIKQKLEELGYLVFDFMQGVDENQPVTSAKQVGRFFAEAGYRLVLDSSNARESVGVRFESRFNFQLNQYAAGLISYEDAFGFAFEQSEFASFAPSRRRLPGLGTPSQQKLLEQQKEVLIDYYEVLVEQSVLNAKLPKDQEERIKKEFVDRLDLGLKSYATLAEKGQAILTLLSHFKNSACNRMYLTCDSPLCRPQCILPD